MAADLESLLLRKAVGSMSDERSSCGCCGRTPVPGELLHELESGPVLCALCLATVPEQERGTVRSERVHAARRQLSVVPRAAAA